MLSLDYPIKLPKIFLNKHYEFPVISRGDISEGQYSSKFFIQTRFLLKAIFVVSKNDNVGLSQCYVFNI